MRKILVTGGTVFVSRYVAEYFVGLGDEVYVLNRGSRPQPAGVKLIRGDRHALGDCLKGLCFDAVLDVTGYTRQDVEGLVDALDNVKAYVFISSSAVYPESLPRPFREEQPCGPNAVWGAYGTNKLAAEEYLLEHLPQAYILRPPYLYGPGENVYRAPFVFDCAEQGRPFCVPDDGRMGLQFFHVEDLCRFIRILLDKKPENRIYNVGNPNVVSILEWVELCYRTVGVPLKTVSAGSDHLQRSFFPFHNYDYCLDVSRQMMLMPETRPLALGIAEEYAWFRDHREEVNRKPLAEYIDSFVLR